MSIRQAALDLESLGFSLFPVLHRTKQPALKWGAYQTHRASRDVVERWFAREDSNIGIATGILSGIVVVDVDDGDAAIWAQANLPATPARVRTGKGEHWYYQHPGGVVRNRAKLKTSSEKINLDLRGDGGYVLGPGSVHPSGAVYEKVGEWPPVAEWPTFDPAWMTSEEEEQRTQPAHRRMAVSERLTRVRKYLEAVPPAIQGAGGDEHTFQVACRITRGFDLSEADTLEVMREWNARCEPPWSEFELAQKIANAREYGDEEVGGRLARPVDWVMGKKGGILPNHMDNLRLALDRLSVKLSYDLFSRKDMIGSKPLEDRDVDSIWIAINDQFGFSPATETLYKLVLDETRKRPFHPVKDYLASLTWDGTPRVNRWLIDYGGADPTPYVEAVGSLTLIAAVRRVRQPGCKFDEMLILEAEQGSLKSSALAALCPKESWFSDDFPLGAGSKEVIERTTGRWLIEAAEMHGHRGRETEQMKAFLSRQVDGPVRLAYARIPVAVPREFIIVATTNEAAHYLKDDTGARRFWPVAVRQFDVEALRRDRDQLWAEAAAREAAGESIRLPRELWPAATEEQEQRRAEDPWESVLRPWLEDRDEVKWIEVFDKLSVEVRHQDTRNTDRLARVLQRLGFRKHRTKKSRSWVRTGTETPEEVELEFDEAA